MRSSNWPLNVQLPAFPAVTLKYPSKRAAHPPSGAFAPVLGLFRFKTCSELVTTSSVVYLLSSASMYTEALSPYAAYLRHLTLVLAPRCWRIRIGTVVVSKTV